MIVARDSRTSPPAVVHPFFYLFISCLSSFSPPVVSFRFAFPDLLSAFVLLPTETQAHIPMSAAPFTLLFIIVCIFFLTLPASSPRHCRCWHEARMCPAEKRKWQKKGPLPRLFRPRSRQIAWLWYFPEKTATPHVFISLPLLFVFCFFFPGTLRYSPVEHLAAAKGRRHPQSAVALSAGHLHFRGSVVLSVLSPEGVRRSLSPSRPLSCPLSCPLSPPVLLLASPRPNPVLPRASAGHRRGWGVPRGNCPLEWMRV